MGYFSGYCRPQTVVFYVAPPLPLPRACGPPLRGPVPTARHRGPTAPTPAGLRPATPAPRRQ
eukprot:1194492-Prorocentrum_minimum.AAC.2